MTPTHPRQADNEQGRALKACPFCNGAEIFVTEMGTRCAKCGTMGPMKNDAGESCHMKPLIAIAAWNTRAAAPTQAGGDSQSTFSAEEAIKWADFLLSRRSRGDRDSAVANDTALDLHAELCEWIRAHADQRPPATEQAGGEAVPPTRWTIAAVIAAYAADDGNPKWPLTAADAVLALIRADQRPERACPTVVCKAAASDGVVCANGECDIESGVRSEKRPERAAGEASLRDALAWIANEAEAWGSVTDDHHVQAIAQKAKDAIGATQPRPAVGDAVWSNEPPTKQQWYWHWNGDEDSAPLPMSVLYSGTSRKCFVSRGQLGMEHATDCDVFGGWWIPMSPPPIYPRWDTAQSREVCDSKRFIHGWKATCPDCVKEATQPRTAVGPQEAEALRWCLKSVDELLEDTRGSKAGDEWCIQEARTQIAQALRLPEAPGAGEA